MRVIPEADVIDDISVKVEDTIEDAKKQGKVIPEVDAIDDISVA